ncbi:hypothetical protein MC81_31230 (plasmid) [Achromobacter insolitus]|nr:hypothetical protein MC81_31230 [Achromobacter insolitus]
MVRWFFRYTEIGLGVRAPIEGQSLLQGIKCISDKFLLSNFHAIADQSIAGAAERLAGRGIDRKM